MSLDLVVTGADIGANGLAVEPPVPLILRRWLSLFDGVAEDRLRNRADILLDPATAISVAIDPDDPYVPLGGGTGIDTGQIEVASMTRLMIMRTTGALNTSGTRPVLYDGSAEGARGSAASVYVSDGLEDGGDPDAIIRALSYFMVGGTPTEIVASLMTTVANIQAWALYAFVWESGVGNRAYDLTHNLSASAASANPRVVNLDHTIRLGIGATIGQSGTLHVPLDVEFEGAATVEQLATLRAFIAALVAPKITGI